MLIPYDQRKIYIANEPVDFRMSIDGLSSIIQRELKSHIHDGGVYVFLNQNCNKVKVLFWDGNGFVLYYKRLVDNMKFKIKKRLNALESITPEELDILLSGFDPKHMERRPYLEHLG